MTLVYAKGLFDLQITFAEKMRDLTGRPLPDVLLECTNLYVRLGFGRAFDADHPGWQAYLAGLRDAADAAEWTYRFYRDEPEVATMSPVVATRGCFAYGLLQGGAVRLHFRNAETNGHSPLAAARVEQRRADLAALFAHVKRTVAANTPVVGMSWLYNLDAYRRLFPPAFTASARVVPDKFRSMPLWGQFVDHRGEVKESMARPFLDALARTSRREELGACFPFHVQAVQAPVGAFLDWYAV